MTKEQTPSKGSNDKQAQSPKVEQIALDEFCARLSETERRYTLISAFHHTETKARRLRDTPANYAARYEAFINQPA